MAKKKKTKLEKQKEEFLSFYARTELIVRETSLYMDMKTRVLSDEIRDILIDGRVEADLESFDRDCFRDILRDGITGYDELSDLELIKDHIDYTIDCYEDISECEQVTFDVKKECELFINNAIDKAIGLKE